jgi:hypothetical protein
MMEQLVSGLKGNQFAVFRQENEKKLGSLHGGN